MKKQLVLSFLLVLLVFLIPWMVGEDPPQAMEIPPQGQEADPPQEQEANPPQEQTAEPIPENRIDETPPAEEERIAGQRDGAVMITVLIDGTVVEMDLGSYLVGVVRAEMPASFEIDALKAQAVAARTYTLYKIASGGSANHPQADTCADINCCKAYADRESAAALWGDRAAEYEEKIRAAVTETDGECVLYDGEPVLAVFHSSSAGMTMNAQDVWSSALPYLKSVSSPETAETVPNFCSSVTMSIAQLRSQLLAALPEARLGGNASDWFTNLRLQTNGTITSLQVGGVEIGGNRLRAILGLRSACFTFSFAGDSVTFSVQGYGHGVGMSQYGANLLARSGMDYREILAWYYTDTTVDVYEG